MIELALTAQVLLWLILIGVFLACRQATIFHPLTVYFGFHGLVFVLRPLLVHEFGFDTNWHYMRFEPTDLVFVRTLAVSSVGLVTFFVACLGAGWTREELLPAALPRFSREERSAFVVTVLLLLPLIGYSIYATRNGQDGERINGVYILTTSTGYIYEAQHFILPLLCAGMVMTRFHWMNLLPSLAYVGYRTWFGWSRWTILLFLLMVTLSYCWYHRRRWIPVWSILVAMPVLVVFNLLGHNRDVLKAILSGEPVQVVRYDAGMTREEKLKKQLDTQDYANFDYLSYVVAVVPERTGAYSLGLQHLQLFTEPIPRILWRGKPIGPPIESPVNLGEFGNFTGLTVSLVGDGWISGG
ncbi:MAG TPA: hypothetical protein DCM86_09200 [Verrucomicrobiales bacterium]|nr:hypothetical protein [Verrucomicrobiales bacterium]